MSSEISELQSGAVDKPQQQHIFQALQYLRKLCSHPSLVLTPDHPEYNEVISELQGQSISSLEFAPKLVALRQLLTDCGIGGAAPAEDEVETVGQHRVLVFCQLRTMLDIIERDLFKAHMPAVTYLRLDGQIEPRKRMDIVTKFNSDPTIDVLLLTTHVGGLGLTLTGADTVCINSGCILWDN